MTPEVTPSVEACDNKPPIDKKAESARSAARKQNLARELIGYRPDILLPLAGADGKPTGATAVFLPVLPGDAAAGIRIIHPAAGTAEDLSFTLADYKAFAIKMAETLKAGTPAG